MDILEGLRTFTEHWNVGDLISLSAVARLVVKEYEDRKADLPDDVKDQLDTLDTVIKSKLSAAKAKKIRDLKLRIDGLKSKDERRADFEKQLAELSAG